MLFPQRLKACRKSKNLTQKQMANILGVSEKQYQSYEYGKYEPNFEKLFFLARFFDVTSDYLLGLK